MAGELNTALLAGLQGAGPNQLALLSNPDVASAVPGLQLSQALLKEGLSTGPATPMQAIGKLAQTLAGEYVQHQSLGNLAQAQERTALNLADQIAAQGDPNNPFVAALRNPATRAVAMQEAPKYFIGAGVPQKTEEESIINLANRLDSHGQHDLAAQLRGQIQKKATNEATGTSYYSTPPQPAPAPPLNPPRVVSGPTPAPPGVQVQATPVKLQPAVGPGSTVPASFADRFAADKARITSAEEQAKNKAQYGDLLNEPQIPEGPGGTKPLSYEGRQIPPLNVQAPIPREPKALDQKLPAWQKTQEEWQKSLQPAYQAEQRLQTIANAFKSIETGAFTTDRADWATKFKALGMTNLADRIMKNPEQAQLALHENYAETMQQLKAATSRFTQQEFKITAENKEHPNLQPAANLQMLAEDIGMLRQSRDLPGDFRIAQQHGWRDPQSFETEWLKANKLSDYVGRARDEIGPLKGMKQPSGQPTLQQGWTYLGIGK